MESVSGFVRIRRALANPNYGVYTAGSSVTLIGTWLQRVAVGWLTWELTGSPAWLGIIAFADLFPTVVIAPIAGAAADRWDRIRVLQISQSFALAQSVTLFLLTVLNLITIELLFGLTLWLGIAAGFAQPARLALVPYLVERQDVTAAVAINSVIFNSARFIGPAAAGVIIVTGGVALAFAINSLSFVAFLFALSRIRLHDDGSSGQSGGSGLLADVGAGIRYAINHPGIAALLALLIVISLSARPFVELLPGFAADVFAGGAGVLAILTSTVGLGAVAAGLWLAGRPAERGHVSVVVVSAIGIAAALLTFVATSSLWLAVPSLAVAGAFMVTSGVGTQTLLQLNVEREMRGRVLSLYGLIFRGGPAIGALVVGALAEGTGLRIALALAVLPTAAAAIWAVLRLGALRAAFGRIHIDL